MNCRLDGILEWYRWPKRRSLAEEWVIRIRSHPLHRVDYSETVHWASLLEIPECSLPHSLIQKSWVSTWDLDSLLDSFWLPKMHPCFGDDGHSSVERGISFLSSASNTCFPEFYAMMYNFFSGWKLLTSHKLIRIIPSGRDSL